MKNTITFKLLAGIQLTLSMLLAVTIIWIYFAYQASFGNLISAISSTALSTSNVIAQMANTINARKSLTQDAEKTLDAVRSTLVALENLAVSQDKILPQYAKNFSDAAAVSANLSMQIGVMGEALAFQVPTNLYFESFLKPKIVWSTPLANQAQVFKAHAKQIQDMSFSLKATSDAISVDAKRVSEKLLASCEQSIHLIDETLKLIRQIENGDLPDAVTKLEIASNNLREVSGRVNFAGDLALGMLCLGLVFAALGVTQSVSMIVMANKIPNSQFIP